MTETDVTQVVEQSVWRQRALRVTEYARRNWLALFSAFVLGLGFPLWRMLVVEQPEIYVEVTDVDKKADTIKVDFDNDPDFKGLFGRSGGVELFMLGQQARRTGDLVELRRLLEQYSGASDESSETVNELRRLRRLLDSQPLSLALADELNGPLFPEIDIDRAAFARNDVAAIEQYRTAFVAKYDAEIASATEGDSARRKALERAKAVVDKRIASMNLEEANIRIDCAISNSGGGGISLKPQGLLRVYLGGGNYFDVPVRMAQHEKNGELSARASKIMRFESDKLHEMRRADQDRINRHFSQNVPATLFVMDIRGRVYESNTVPFARGLYEQTVFDRLVAEASKSAMPERRSLASFLY